MPLDPTQPLKLIAKLLQKGVETRAEIITEVNNLSSAISAACNYTAMRFNQALVAKNAAEKIDILMSVTDKEVESHARMNGMCAPITQAARELEDFYSDISISRRLGKKDELMRLLMVLRQGEVGLQKVMLDFMDIGRDLQWKSEEEINDYIRERLNNIKELSESASDCQFAISKVI